jgi:hypothetical protein
MAGSAHGTREQRRFTFTEDMKFHAGKNRISLLSVAVGLPVSSPIPTQKTRHDNLYLSNLKWCMEHGHGHREQDKKYPTYNLVLSHLQAKYATKQGRS